MAAAVAAFVILLTFVFDAEATATRTLRCSDQQCVEIIIEQAYKSPSLRRLKVFDADQFKGTFPLGNTAFPPVLDLTFN